MHGDEMRDIVAAQKNSETHSARQRKSEEKISGKGPRNDALSEDRNVSPNKGDL